MRIRDELGEVYQNSAFQELFSGKGQPAKSPRRLAWVTVMQFYEGLSDRQAEGAVRGRLIEGWKEQLLLDALLRALQERQLIKAGGKQQTDSTHILAAVRQLNRVEIVGETMHQALNELAEDR